MSNRRGGRRRNHMARAMSPCQHEISQLNGQATAMLDAITPASSVGFRFRQAQFDLEIFELECEYDVSRPWPHDPIVDQLTAWRFDLDWQTMELAVARAMQGFAVFADAAGLVAQSVTEFGAALRAGIEEWMREEWWVSQ